jgi:hypothetical protein
MVIPIPLYGSYYPITWYYMVHNYYHIFGMVSRKTIPNMIFWDALKK